MAEDFPPAMARVPGSIPSDEMPTGVFECRDPGDLCDKLRKSMHERRKKRETKEECLELLQNWCRINGITCSGETPQNESCFFHAISEQMLQCGLTPLNAYDLRSDLVSDMQRQPLKKIPGGVIDLASFVSGSWTKYLNLMRRPDTFADEVAMVAMAHYLKKDILIIPSFKLSPLYDAFMVCGHQHQCPEPMLIVGHVCDKYFQRVFPLSTSLSRNKAPPRSAAPSRHQRGARAAISGTQRRDVESSSSKTPSDGQDSRLDAVLVGVPRDRRDLYMPAPSKPPRSYVRDTHSRLRYHPAVLAGIVKRKDVPRDVVPGGKYPGWQVDLYHDRANTRGFDPDRSFDEPGVPFQFQDDLDARLLNIEREICMAREIIEDKRNQMVDRSRDYTQGAKADIKVLLQDIESIEECIAGLEEKAKQIRINRYYNSVSPQRRRDIQEVIERELQKLASSHVPTFQPGTLRGTLREHANKTATDDRTLSEQVQNPMYYSKHEWIACGVVDFLTQIEIIRDIVGTDCSSQSCSEFQNINGLLNRAGSTLDDDTIFPLLIIESYPENIMKNLKIMFTYLCEIYKHFYKHHLSKIGPSRVDVVHIGLHFYAFSKTFHLVNDRLLDALIAAFMGAYF